VSRIEAQHGFVRGDGRVVGAFQLTQDAEVVMRIGIGRFDRGRTLERLGGRRTVAAREMRVAERTPEPAVVGDRARPSLQIAMAASRSRPCVAARIAASLASR
jgi:hypothetical protein